MRIWLSRLVGTCIRFLRWLLQRLTRPVRPRWMRGSPASRSCTFRAQPKPAWVRHEIIRLKALMPAAGCRTIAHCFNRRFAVCRQMTVGKTYVADTIRAQQYAILCARRKVKHAVPRRLPRNLIWGLDLTVNRDTQGRDRVIPAIVDHGSRACLSLQSLRDKSTRTLLQGLLETCRRYGRPKYVRTDNEGSLTTWRFRVWLRTLGIRHQRTTPGCPWQNGRVERLFGTLKVALGRWPVADVAQLDEALGQFRLYYHHLRPHQHLQGRTPAEVWAGVDIFADTPQGRAWQRAWLRRFPQYCRAVG